MSASSLAKNTPGDLMLRAGDDNYLGDPETVDMLLRVMASNVLAERKLNRDVGTSLEENHAAAMTNIFLGKEPDFTPMHGWNAPGFIDEFVSSAANVQENTPEDRMRTFFLSYLIDTYSLVEYADAPGVLDEQWQPQVGALVDYYRDILIGYIPEFEG